VLPYNNCRLVFAALAAQAVFRGGFDSVAVDLPSFMGDRHLLDLAIDAFPLVSSIILRKSNGEFRTFNFVPNDAACAALYTARRLKERGTAIEYACVDDTGLIHYPVEFFAQNDGLVLPDDGFALTDGVQGYFAGAFSHLKRLMADLPDEMKFFWDRRATVVANRLRWELRSGRKTLFVCNYRLWNLVNAKLASGENDQRNLVFPHEGEYSAALVFQDPLLLWVQGALDDFPAVVLSFAQGMQMEKEHAFDKFGVLNTLIFQSIIDLQTESPRSVSSGRLLAFSKYLRSRLCLSKRLTPVLSQFLHDAARACLGRERAKVIAKGLLEYPRPEESFIRFLTLLHDSIIWSGVPFDYPDEFNQVYLNLGSGMETLDGYEVFEESMRQREKLVAGISPFLKESEATALKGFSGMKWALRQDYQVHSVASRQVRRVLETKAKAFRSMKSMGSLGDGVDWKATIRARAKGEKGFYIKRSRNLKTLGSGINPFTPVVFILDELVHGGRIESVHDSNRTNRNMELGNTHLITPDSPEPDYVYSVFAIKTSARFTCKNHIRRKRISAILFLYTELWMGVERYERLVSRPDRYQCRRTPDEDKELMVFDYPHRLIACGVKYAEDRVIVVCRDSWEPSPDLETYAKSKGIGIVRVPLTAFSDEFVERLRQFHFVSTPLKKHPDMEAILERYLPDVFEF
jgi:hypothetical protein